MIIHYFEIRNCSLLYYMGYPIYLAPDGTDEGLLSMRGFAKQNDGKWIKYIDRFEYGYIMQFNNCEEIVVNEETLKNIQYPPFQYQPPLYGYGAAPPKDSNTANILCTVSVSLMLLTLPVLFTPLIAISGLLFIAAMVLMIIARVIYPDNKFAKILCIVYVVLTLIMVVIGIAAIIMLMIACNECVNSLNSCS
ncbi:MAG: hypothetical protein IKW96_11220 [Ruminococcus sp.]|uniref:hypothetical protein n=1 Tax=Ruminococcus sp. TaxID=41978 RepID=UPI0025EAD7AA|nr:hypothetical protein [Ruminococcus sp.]MBR5683821.1 hypothetical protein [Ruminococcus sp.]